MPQQFSLFARLLLILFSLFLPDLPTVGQTASPKIPSFWDLRNLLVEEREKDAGGGVLGRGLGGFAPQERKEFPLKRRKNKTSLHPFRGLVVPLESRCPDH